jgi:hypothetical protein
MYRIVLLFHRSTFVIGKASLSYCIERESDMVFSIFGGPVRIFSKIRDYIRKQRLITGVNDTDDK